MEQFYQQPPTGSQRRYYSKSRSKRAQALTGGGARQKDLSIDVYNKLDEPGVDDSSIPQVHSKSKTSRMLDGANLNRPVNASQVQNSSILLQATDKVYSSNKIPRKRHIGYQSKS